MIIRLIKVILVPVLIISMPLESVFYGIRWIITGKNYPDEPLFVRLAKY